MAEEWNDWKIIEMAAGFGRDKKSQGISVYDDVNIPSIPHEDDEAMAKIKKYFHLMTVKGQKICRAWGDSPDKFEAVLREIESMMRPFDVDGDYYEKNLKHYHEIERKWDDWKRIIEATTPDPDTRPECMSIDDFVDSLIDPDDEDAPPEIKEFYRLSEIEKKMLYEARNYHIDEYEVVLRRIEEMMKPFDPNGDYYEKCLVYRHQMNACADPEYGFRK